jgi:hypothetical protein
VGANVCKMRGEMRKRVKNHDELKFERGFVQPVWSCFNRFEDLVQGRERKRRTAEPYR